ncbi:serine threonine-protein kinase [Seminavis robusta]|uniref:Serine threonine-protein kinase n=1 Tax=Seminavis robusta TaxID=568900 RepID=A0A9N8DEZ6_9STRA|nr:serine threonine-protein kinase [Seminavis robusta]|eukprot:Sro118_g057610.1 serine threonine-protein kinase (481) ;mRNA; f:13842-15460
MAPSNILILVLVALRVPILQAVICRIIRIMVDNKETDAPTAERQLAGSFGKNESEEVLPLMLASMVQKPIEIKVGRANRGKFVKGTEKERSQVVGHLGKRLEYCFPFGGVGFSSSCIGIVLTTLSIEVIRMDLSNVGSTDVALDLLGTGLVPVRLVKDTELPEGIKKLHVKEKGEEIEATDGFVLLAGALKHEIPKDFGTEASIKQVHPEEQELVVVDYLASGAFANVVQLGPEEFMKIPKPAALATSLEGEADILMWQTHSVHIITNVYEALKYAHSKSIYHLDVRPGNIIVKVEEENEEPSVMLSDWGCSVQGKRALKSFHGCTPYAHDRLLGDDFHGRLAADLDFASLAYTIDHIKHHQLRWMFQFDRPKNVCTDDLDLRRELVREWLGQQDPAQEPSWLEISETIRESMCAACRLNVRRSLRDKKENPEENAAVPLEDSVTNAPTKESKKVKTEAVGVGNEKTKKRKASEAVATPL